MNPSTAIAEGEQRQFLPLFLLLLGLYCWWVLSLPLFPTQDDPMHLYYVSVLAHLKAGSPLFSKYFFIRHPPPPYTVHYAILLWLASFLPFVWAEKCMACLILVSTALGFRFLARSVGPNSGVMSLWIIPLALSWPLFMGFHNYCLSLSFGLWALGVWFRATRKHNVALFFLFLLLIVLILFTHPVPLLFVLAIVAGDVVIRMAQTRWAQPAPLTLLITSYRWDLLFAALAFCSLAYIALFVNKSSSAQDLTAHFSRAAYASELARLSTLCLATGGVATQLYRCALYAVLLLVLGLAWRGIRRHLRSANSSATAVLLLCAVAMIVVVPLLPRDMNGSQHFSDRLVICIWIAAIAAGSAGQALRPRVRNGMAIAASLLAVFAIGLANHVIRPTADRLALIEQAPVELHKLGILLDAPIKEKSRSLTFDPYLRWAGARYFRRAQAVMLNSPWLNLPILPLGRRPNALTDRFSPFELDVPPSLHEHLMNSPADREALLSSIDLIVFVGKPEPNSPVPDPLLAGDAGKRWRCHQNVWYFVCEATGPVR